MEGGGEVIDPLLNGLEQEVGMGLTMGGLLFSSMFCSSLIWTAACWAVEAALAALAAKEATAAACTLSCRLARRLSILNGDIFLLISASICFSLIWVSWLVLVSPSTSLSMSKLSSMPPTTSMSPSAPAAARAASRFRVDLPPALWVS